MRASRTPCVAPPSRHILGAHEVVHRSLRDVAKRAFIVRSRSTRPAVAWHKKMFELGLRGLRVPRAERVPLIGALNRMPITRSSVDYRVPVGIRIRPVAVRSPMILTVAPECASVFVLLKIMSVSGNKFIHDGYLPAPTAEQLAAAAAKVAAGDGRAATQPGQVESLRAASAAAPTCRSSG